jgi:hypothetical protein
MPRPRGGLLREDDLVEGPVDELEQYRTGAKVRVK